MGKRAGQPTPATDDYDNVNDMVVMVASMTMTEVWRSGFMTYTRSGSTLRSVMAGDETGRMHTATSVGVPDILDHL